MRVMPRLRSGYRQRLAVVVAAAVLPLAAVEIMATMLGVPPTGHCAALGVALLVSAVLAWRIGSATILLPVARIAGMLGTGGRRRPRTIGELEEALQVLMGELDRCEAKTVVAEEALHHSTDVLRSMVTALPVGVVAIGRNGRIELWNHAAEAILGYSADEMVGRPTPTDIFAPVAEGGAAADVFLRMVTGQMVKGEEVQCCRKDGSLVAALFSGAPLMDEDDRLRGAICVFEDISQRKAIATQLQQAQKMEAVGQLTGGLAHDFNNILGVAVGNLDLLESELDHNPQAAELVETALNALLRGAELTRALLAFSRRQPLTPARVDAAELLTVATRMLSRTLGEHVRVTLRAEGDLHPVLVDAAQLEAAITNLAINARDAMPNGGTLTITASNTVLDDDYTSQTTDVASGKYLLIEISDTGTGMSPEVLERVFEPFFTTKPVGQGTGLGLSMVYGFIKQSGGHIRIYSEVGHGTTVRLYLPKAPDRPGEPATAPLQPESIPGGTETVLVVEDNADVRRMVENQLSRLGYQVIAAGHGPAALAVLETGVPVDLLFTDVVMPEGMTGFELAEAALRQRPNLKVLVTSGFPGSNLRRPTGALEPVELLSKPYRRQDLARAVRDTLDGKGGKT
jgi:PAS domain S-box-containing protein